VVIGEGHDERGAPRSTPPFHVVPKKKQGAMEIIVRRKLYAIRSVDGDPPWHAALDDEIDVLQPPAVRQSMVEVLAKPELLALIVGPTLRPQGKPPRADLLVVTHDAEDAANTVAALEVVNSSFRTRAPLLLPSPEIQAWLTSKRAVERVYEHEHCTVPEVDEARLKADAKLELERLLAAHGDVLSGEKQARLAEVISLEDVRRFGWNGWGAADDALRAALEPG
jgi:hypothetical protein